MFVIFSPPLPSVLCPFCVILRLKALPWFRLAGQIYLIIRIQNKSFWRLGGGWPCCILNKSSANCFLQSCLSLREDLRSSRLRHSAVIRYIIFRPEWLNPHFYTSDIFLAFATLFPSFELWSSVIYMF